MISKEQPPETREWAVRGRSVFIEQGLRPATVLVRDETIVAVLGPNEAPTGVSLIDAGDCWVLPGLVETHAHVNEPGRADWEGFASATRAAAAGGITTLIDMPLNSRPVTTTVEALTLKQAAANGQMMVDCGFHAGIVPGNATEVCPLIEAGVCGFKAFLCHSGIDDFPNSAEADLRAVMPLLAAADLPLLVHAELVSALPVQIEQAFAEAPHCYAAYLATRPRDWEIAAIRLMIDLCREYRCRVHIVHLSAAEESRPLLAAARAEGLPLTVETCPHYLFFAAEEIPDADPRFKCAPPIREGHTRNTLRQMVLSEEVDTIGSDHSPAPPGLKQLGTGNLRSAWGGIASLQLLLPVAWTAIGSVRQVVSALTRKPAELAGILGRKGAIAPGHDADLVLFNPDAEFVVTADMLQHKHKPTPYLGQSLRGIVERTWLRGRTVFQQGDFPSSPAGRLLSRASRARA